MAITYGLSSVCREVYVYITLILIKKKKTLKLVSYTHFLDKDVEAGQGLGRCRDLPKLPPSRFWQQ